MPARKPIVRGAAALCAALLCAAAYLWLSTPLPALNRLRERAALGSTRVLDRQGRLLFEAPDPFGARRRPLPLAQIPLALRQAAVAVEDAGFYENRGIDLRGIARAAWQNARIGAVVSGGSTITQQLARAFLLDPALGQQRTAERKLREAVLALKIGAALSKDEVLELYLNQTYYGGMAYGVEPAARRLFAKPAAALDLAECALIAGLPQAPSRYDPLAGDAARAAAIARQHAVLDAMVREHYLSPAQAQAARAEALQFAGDDGALPPNQPAPHFVRYVLGQLAERLGPDAVARGGLVVTTTLDLDMQRAAEASLRRQLEQLSAPRDGEPDHKVRNGAVVVLDPATGAILAMVGSPRFDDAASQGEVNGALALRQPGSAIKPLTYAAALERGWTPVTTILDAPAAFPTRAGPPYQPANYDRVFHGPLSLREALATSSNVAAVRTLDHIGVPALLAMARRLGITSLSQPPDHYGLALTLGGGEVTLLELTAAYGALANGGWRVEPFAVLAIQTRDTRHETRDTRHETAYSDSSGLPPSGLPLSLSPQVAYLIADILSDRYARMRAFGLQSTLDVDRPAAAKTGTTSDWRDNWAMGFSPDRAVGVWVGNANGQPMRAVSGIDGAGPVWHDVMLAAHRGLPPRPFPRPPGIVERAVCAEAGLLPTASCPATRLERFVVGTEPQRDALAASTDAPSASGAPALVSPAAGALFAIDPTVDPARQQIALEATAPFAASSLTLLVDGAPVATLAAPPFRTLWRLQAGSHTVVAEARDASGRARRSTAVEFVVTRPVDPAEPNFRRRSRPSARDALK